MTLLSTNITPMETLVLACGTEVPNSIRLPQIPSRQDLRFLDEAATRHLPQDPTPSLDEIARQPEVRHLGAPQPAPQHPEEMLRVVVIGSDAALSAVLTRMMRADYLWAEVGFVPTGSSVAAITWNMSADLEGALEFACTAPARPTPLIRSDSAIAVAGSASLTEFSGREFTGEIVVDNTQLVCHEATDARFFGAFGVRIVPTTDAPGLAALRLTSPLESEDAPHGPWRVAPQQLQSWSEHPVLRHLVRFSQLQLGQADPSSLAEGRAVQAGGRDIALTIDGVKHKRPLKRAVLYRHLRDAQIVRP